MWNCRESNRLNESCPALHWYMNPMCVERVIEGISTFFT